MAKRKFKNSVDNLAAAQPRLPKTRRRECPTKIEEPKAVDLQANCQEIAADASLPKESTVILAVEQQRMEHQLLVTEGNAGDREVTDVSANTKVATVTEVGWTAFNNTHAESKPEHLRVPINNDTSQNGDLEEFVVVAEPSRAEPHSCIDPLQDNQGALTSFEDQPHTHKSSHGNIVQETDQHSSSNDSTSDVKKATMETQVFLPAEKKPLIEILDQVEEVSLGPSSEFFKTGDAVQMEAGGSDGNEGIQAKVCGVVIILNRLSAVFGLAKEDQSCKGNDGVVGGPQESGDARSDLRSGQEDQEQQQLDGTLVENWSEEPPQQMKGAEDVDQSPSPGLNFITLKNKAAESSNATKTTPLLVSSDTVVAGENSNHLARDAGEGSSSAETSSRGCAIGPAASSLGSEKKDTLDVNDDTGSSFRSPEPCRMKDSKEPFGPAYLDYVSDSQLNTIPLTEEEIVKGEKDLRSPDCPDGTDLICGLIKELSWLNRKVMATHRELESMRRSTKSMRSSTR